MRNIMSDIQKAKPSYLFLVPMIVETMYKKIWATAKEQKKDKALKFLIKISNALLAVGIDIRRKLFQSVLGAFGGNLDWVSCGGAAIDIKYIVVIPFAQPSRRELQTGSDVPLRSRQSRGG